MPINTQEEKLLSLTEATKSIPKVDGKRPHVSSAWRWIKLGLNGVHLEHVKVGGRLCTSVEALNRFFNALAEKESGLITKPRVSPKVSTKRRTTQIEAAEKTLAEAGIGGLKDAR